MLNEPIKLILVPGTSLCIKCEYFCLYWLHSSFAFESCSNLNKPTEIGVEMDVICDGR